MGMGKEQARLAELEAWVAVLREDKERLDWWGSHKNYEHEMDWVRDEVLMYRCSGPLSNPERIRVATGKSLREVIDIARGKRKEISPRRAQEPGGCPGITQGVTIRPGSC